MNESNEIEGLVREVDKARLSGDVTRILEIEAEIREITGGKPRRITGTSHMTIPLPIGKSGGKVEDFDEWNRPS